MNCKFCGKSIPDEAVICGYCGVPVNQSQIPQSNPPIYQGSSNQNNTYQENSYSYACPPNYNQNMDGGANGIAILSLCLGIGALLLGCCSWFLSLGCIITGIIFSIIALNNPSVKESSKGMAIAGLVCSIAAIVPLFLFLFIFI